MTDKIDIAFGPLGQGGQGGQGDLVVFLGDDLALGGPAKDALGGAGTDLVAKAAASEKFKGRSLSAMVLPAPAGLSVDRLVVVGLGSDADRAKIDWPALGGFTAAKVSGRNARIVLDLPGVATGPEQAAAFALGARLRAYTFDRYKTKKKPDSEDKAGTSLTVLTADHAAASREAENARTLAESVILARDLVNEPPNVLFPEEFARRAGELAKLGVEGEALCHSVVAKIPDVDTLFLLIVCLFYKILCKLMKCLPQVLFCQREITEKISSLFIKNIFWI